MSLRSLSFIAIVLPLLVACSGAPDEESPSTVIEPIEGAPGMCAVSCIFPPPGCEYRGGLYTGPCQAVNCGHLVCDPGKTECPILDCAAPPPGCHYEGMVTSPCNQQTCGYLVCDSASL